jgi:hypothetical protein
VPRYCHFATFRRVLELAVAPLTAIWTHPSSRNRLSTSRTWTIYASRSATRSPIFAVSTTFAAAPAISGVR